MAEKRSFDNFDTFAKDYRTIHNNQLKFSGADSDYFSEYKVAEISKLEGDAKSFRILDLGCGDGNSAKFFIKHFTHSHIDGIDISEDSIVVAKDKNLERCDFRPYDGQNIPFEENQFDFVLIATVMHHIGFSYHVALMKEVYRVLKPGGRLYIFEHNPHNPVTRKMVDNCPFDADAVLLKPSYSKNLLKDTGFERVTNTFTIFFPRSAAFKFLLPLEAYLGFIPLGGQYYTLGHKAL